MVKKGLYRGFLSLFGGIKMITTQPRTIHTSKYDVDYSAPVGRGSWGVVYRGKMADTGKPVLIKILDPTEMALHQLQKRGQNLEDVLTAEDRDLEPLSRVVPGRIERDDDNQPFLVMREYARSLQSMDRNGRTYVGHGLAQQQALGYLRDIMTGIRELHDLNRIHNDLRLDNIVVDDENSHAFITDLGASQLASAGISFVSPATIDVVSLRAPEIFRENISPSKASDIYSISSLAYRFFTGKYLFDGRFDNIENVSPVFEGIGEDAFNTIVSEQLKKSKFPRRLQRVLRKGLAYDPQKRFQSVDAFESDFDGAMKPRILKIFGRIAQAAALGTIITSQSPQGPQQRPYFIYDADHRPISIRPAQDDETDKQIYKTAQKDKLSQIRFEYEKGYRMPQPSQGWDLDSTSDILEEKLLADVKIKDITDNFLVGELLVAYNKAMAQVVQNPKFGEKIRGKFFNAVQAAHYESIRGKKIPPLDKDMKMPQVIVAEGIKWVLYDTFARVEKEYQVFDLEDILTKMRLGATMRGIYQKNSNRTDFKDYASHMDPEERAFLLAWAGNIRKYLLIPEMNDEKITTSSIEDALPDTRRADREFMRLMRKDILTRNISDIKLVREDNLQLPKPRISPASLDNVLEEHLVSRWGNMKVKDYTENKLVGIIGLGYWRAYEEIDAERNATLTRYMAKNMANEEQTRAYEIMTGKLAEYLDIASAMPITFKSIEHALSVNAGLAFGKEVDLEDVIATSRFGEQNMQKAWQNSRSFDFKNYLKHLLKNYSTNDRECETIFLNKWLANISLEK